MLARDATMHVLKPQSCAVPREAGGLQDADAEEPLWQRPPGQDTAGQADPVKVRCCSLQTFLMSSYMIVQ